MFFAGEARLLISWEKEKDLDPAALQIQVFLFIFLFLENVDSGYVWQTKSITIYARTQHIPAVPLESPPTPGGIDQGVMT